VNLRDRLREVQRNFSSEKESELSKAIRRVRRREPLRDREGVVRRSVRRENYSKQLKARETEETKLERTSFASCETRGL